MPRYCIFENCQKQPIYGIKGSKNAEYCAEHKLLNYVDVHNKKCIYEKCQKRDTYIFPGFSPEYCKIHSKKKE